MIPNHPRTLAWEPLDSEHILACARVPFLKVRDVIDNAGKGKWLVYIQQKAKFDCCRNPENLDVEAWFSKSSESAPDLYKFYCKVCEGLHNQGDDRGYCHAMFCVGGSHPKATGDRPDLMDIRPMWDVR